MATRTSKKQSGENPDDAEIVGQARRSAKPEVAESEPIEPKPTEPKPTEPKSTESEPTEPKPTEPELTEPELTEPELTEPEPAEPELTEPELTEPEPALSAKSVQFEKAVIDPVQFAEALKRQQAVIRDVTEALADLSATIASYVPFIDSAKLRELCQQLKESHDNLKSHANQ
jgi:hypothetical protein